MHDVKIPRLTEMSEELRQSILKGTSTVTEKIDGTKLTVIKHNNDIIVSYKSNVITPEELSCVSKEHAKASYGMGQYKIALQKIHEWNHNIPLRTKPVEFLFEFVQKKHTIHREYSRYHDVFFVSAAETDYIVSKDGLEVFSMPKTLCTKSSKHGMGYGSPVFGLPVLNQEIAPLVKFENFQQLIFDSVCSVLGGKVEGVVIDDGQGNLKKIVDPKQYDPIFRKEQSKKFRCDSDEEEQEYWRSVVQVSKFLIDSLDLIYDKLRCQQSTHDRLRVLSSILYGNSDIVPPFHQKKNRETCIDDVMLTCKLILKLDHQKTDRGVIVMSGKPVHSGHWELIKKVSQAHERVDVYISTSDRENVKGEKMFQIWKEFLVPNLPANVHYRFSDSPYVTMKHDIVSAQKYGLSCKFNWYTAKKDVASARSGMNGVNIIDVDPLAETSGTELRAALLDEDRNKFICSMPKFMTGTQRDRVWDLLKNS
jgi:hypothetical protein